MLIAVMGIGACTKTNDFTLPAASVKGIMNTYNEFGRVHRTSGISIQLDDGLTRFNTLTDRNGKYEFANIPMGVYNISFTRDSFGTKILYSRSIIGGNLPTYINENLIQQSTTIVDTLWAETDTSNRQIIVKGYIRQVSTIDEPRFISIFLNTDTAVSVSNFNEFHNLKAFTGQYFEDRFKNDPIYSRGDSFYIVAYGCTSGGAQGYFDASTRRTIYTNLNATPSNKVKLYVP